MKTVQRLEDSEWSASPLNTRFTEYLLSSWFHCFRVLIYRTYLSLFWSMSENLNRHQVWRCSSWELATMPRRRVKWRRRGDKHVVNYKVIFHHWLCITGMLSSAESSLGIRAVSAALEPRIMTDIRLKKKGGTISSGKRKRYSDSDIIQGLASMINESYWSYLARGRFVWVLM